MKKIIFNGLIACMLIGCASTRGKMVKKIDMTIGSSFFNDQFTGFLVFDPATKDTLYSKNSTKYFIPASNTKIFTLFAATTLLPDKIPSLKYKLHNNMLYIEGTGNPTMLHPYFKDSTVLHFLENYPNISVHLNNFKESKFGPGWSWDDYQWYYSPERNGLPLYGNVLTLYQNDSLIANPDYFKDKIVPLDYTVNRESEDNVFYFDPSRKDTLEVPFKVDTLLTKTLLENALRGKVTLALKMPEGEKKILYGIASDSVYKHMMRESDNFLAEQLLILASSTLSEELSSSETRDFILKNSLNGLRQPPRWVDGSGLSRYNLFTPESMVDVLQRLYAEIPRERLFDFFPKGGVSGTLKDWYPGNPEPYMFAKTGSLSNNHCLSGYLITKSGKTLIFSFMNNHFLHPSSEVKKRMQRIFEEIRDSY